MDPRYFDNEVTICDFVLVNPVYYDVACGHSVLVCVAEGRGPFGAMATAWPIYEMRGNNKSK